MTNLYVFWKETADPPSPWTRLTRTNQYLRCNSSTANHWTNTGSTTHTPVPSSNYTTYASSTGVVGESSPDYTKYTLDHRHTLTATYPSANNTPPAYGLDIIYMDIDLWESTKRIFPDGTVLVSNGILTDAGYLSRFTAADGKYITNATPGTTSGSSSTHSHSATASVGDSPVPGTTNCSGSSNMILNVSTTHNHNGSVSISSSSTYQEPSYIVTRLYEVLADTTKALSGTVVFVDGSVGSLWEILTSWNGKNIKSGNYNPTYGGSDTHSHTLSGTLDIYYPTTGNTSGGTISVTSYYHNHTYSATTTDSNIPSSRYIIPARLLTTVYRPSCGASPQIVGLSAW